MKLIDGTALAEKVHAETALRVARLRERGVVPGLAVVLVGNHPASRAYVRAKDKKAAALGFHSRKIELEDSTSQEELLGLIHQLNSDPAIHGILVQSPPPPHIDEAAVTAALDPAKDVDGFHAVNAGKLALEDPTAFVPCTPLGCLRLLEEAGVELRGAEVTIVGRSKIVGKPLALLLMQKGVDATVTVAHSRTRELAAVTRRAQVVVAALGRPRALGAEHISPGAIVIDVGINRVADPSHPKGSRLVGDVDFEAVAERCAAITPVPGGVGPMTIAMLMANTVAACERAVGV